MVDHFIKHLSNASVMDLLLKVISCEETAEGTGILEWLRQTDLIRCLMSKFDPANGAEVVRAPLFFRRESYVVAFYNPLLTLRAFFFYFNFFFFFFYFL